MAMISVAAGRQLGYDFEKPIVLPKGSPRRPMLDAAVLDQIESEWWQQTLFETIGNARSP